MGLEGNFTFQHDNDPKHTSQNTKLWLLYNVPKQLNTPSHCPDINPTEHVWQLVDARIRKHNITCKSSLKTTLQEEWPLIAAEETRKLVESMSKRLLAVIQAKGTPTKY